MSQQVTAADAATCLKCYPSIGPVSSITLLTGAFHNTLFHVLTEGGEFYLKVLTTHSNLSTEERYEFLDWAAEQFHRVGVEAPVAIRNAEGNRLTCCGAYPAMLSAAIGGDEFKEERPEQQASAGRVLGLFHRTAAHAPRRGSSWLKPLGGYLLLDGSLLDDLPDVPEAPVIRHWGDELLRQSERMAGELTACCYTSLPQSAVHGEVTGKHMRVRGNRVSGVLDFEYACWDARVIDVGRSLICLSCVGPEAEDDAPQRTRSFLGGYESAGWPLQPEEVAALPTLVKVWDFECVTFFIHHIVETRAPIQRFDLGARISDCLTRVDWWEQHGDRVADQLSRIRP